MNPILIKLPAAIVAAALYLVTLSPIGYVIQGPETQIIEEDNKMFTINYHTGIGNDTATSLDDAMNTADQNASYTQESITVEDGEGNIIATRKWWGSLDGIEECESPIRFGEYGYYGDWEIE